jgi:hypothetical protein
MTDSDKKRFAAAMYSFTAIYEMDFSSKAVLKIWFESLANHTIEEIESAVTRYIKSPDFGSYKPKPSDLIKILEGTSDDRAFSAWSKLEKAVRRVGTYKTVVFDDPIIHRVVDDMGGWCEIGRKEERELPFVSKEFCQRYRAFSSKSIIPDHSKKLLGLSEGDNTARGFEHKEEPVLCGDEEKALLVYSGKAIKMLGEK